MVHSTLQTHHLGLWDAKSSSMTNPPSTIMGSTWLWWVQHWSTSREFPLFSMHQQKDQSYSHLQHSRVYALLPHATNTHTCRPHHQCHQHAHACHHTCVTAYICVKPSQAKPFLPSVPPRVLGNIAKGALAQLIAHCTFVDAMTPMPTVTPTPMATLLLAQQSPMDAPVAHCTSLQTTWLCCNKPWGTHTLKN